MFEILSQNFHQTANAKRLKLLIGNSKVLEKVCLRPPMWNMATSAYSVSPGLYRSWVLSAEELSRTAISQCSRVSAEGSLHAEPI